jgi:hypothetical protein
MSEEKKAEQDERVAFEAEWKRSGWGDADTKNQCFHFWQARAASTSANVDRFDPYRLKVAEECCERLMSACTDAGCPDGVRMDDWIRDTVARVASTANVAQGAEAVALTEADVERQYKNGIHIGSGLPRETCPCGFCAKHRFGFNYDAQSQIAEVCEDADGYKHIEAVIEDLDELPKGMKLYAAPPAQTALTDEQITDIRRAAVLIRENSYPFPDKPHSNWALADRIDKIISGDKS